MTARMIVLSAFALAFFAPVLAGSETEAQVSELKVWHRSGQTFLTWKEADPPIKEETADIVAVKALLKNMDKTKKVRYCIYRSDKPIESVDGIKPIASVRPLSCWNHDFTGVYPKKGQKAPRYVVEEGEGPVPPGTGIYVHNPQKAGDAYYAVTLSVADKENKALGEGNVTKAPVKDTVGQGEPVLQRKREKINFLYESNVSLHFYVRWEAPPNCNRESRPYDYMVGIPAKFESPSPVGLHLHCWGANLQGGYIWWNNCKTGAFLISSNQIPYDWWTGYHESYGLKARKKASWSEGVVRPYSQRRMLSFLDWAIPKYKLDRNRVFVAGSSMGGSGAPMFAIRHSDRIAWGRGDVGVHVPSRSPQFASSYRGVYGNEDWGIKYEDGTPVWDYFSDPWYLRKYPKKEIGFITFSNGKNDGQIGWPQAVEFIKAMQETKRPHLAVWGMSGHGQRATMPKGGGRANPIDIRSDQSLPAFTKCSLDNNPGTGRRKTDEEMAKHKDEVEAYNKTHRHKIRVDKYDGEQSGQINRYLYWETDNIVDTEDGWEMTVGLIAKDQCTVDITPRRLQKLKPQPGEKFKWTNSEMPRFAGAVGGGKELQSGEVVADENGLLTLEKVTVSKSKNRIRISR